MTPTIDYFRHVNSKQIQPIPEEVVLNKIYLIRGHKLMLDRDLAELYGVKSIRLREQGKRNQLRFPENFMFQLSHKEVNALFF